MTPSSTKKDPAAQDDLSADEKQAATNAKRAATRAANKASAGDGAADGKPGPKKRGPKPGAKAAAEAANKASGDVDADEADDVEEDIDDIILEGPDVVDDAEADPAKAVAGSGCVLTPVLRRQRPRPEKIVRQWLPRPGWVRESVLAMSPGTGTLWPPRQF